MALAQSARPHTQPEINAYRRRCLIEGAIRSLADHGTARTTLKTIAGAANASHGLVGHYFGSKDDLMAAAFRHLCEAIAEEIGRVARESGTDTVGRLRAVLDVTFAPPAFGSVNLRAFVMFWHEALTNGRLRSIKHELYGDYREMTARLFARAARERGLTVNARSAATGLIALVDGLWLELALDPSTCTLAEARAIGEDYIDGVLARAAAKARA
jgi:AcrR family transcriptional regulator